MIIFDYELIKQIMTKYNITCRQLARSSGVSKSQISRLANGEQGKKNPKGIIKIVQDFKRRGIMEADEIISQEHILHYIKNNKYYSSIGESLDWMILKEEKEHD